MTTTENTPTVTTVSRIPADWLRETTTTITRPEGEAMTISTGVYDSPTFGHHASVTVSRYSDHNYGAVLYVPAAHRLRAQIMDDGTVTLEAQTGLGNATFFMPFTVDQVLAALARAVTRAEGRVS